MIKKLVWLLVFGLVACAVAWYFVGRIPPRTLTLRHMITLRGRILSFAREQDRLPATLAALPPAAGREDAVLDGWKRPILYRIDAGDIVTLTSYGADGAPGGTEEMQDLFGRFATRDEQSHWIEMAGAWLQYPLDPAVEGYEGLRARAEAMGETPEGKAYEQHFTEVINEPLQVALARCSITAKPPFRVEMVFELAADGNSKRIVPMPDERVSTCLAQRLAELHLPPPPRENWLVYVSIDVKK